MRGLRTQEGNKFENFFEKVNEQAALHNSVFFLDCGEGREFSNQKMEGEDLSGWLIPADKVNEFEKEFLSSHEISEKWNNFVTFAFWSFSNNKLNITFKQF